MKIWKYKGGRKWTDYFKPVWLNNISWTEGRPKIYRWLWWGYSFDDQRDIPTIL